MDQNTNFIPSPTPDKVAQPGQLSGPPAWLPEDESIGRLIKVFKKRGLLVLIVAAAGLAAGIAANVLLPKLYTAQSAIEVTPDVSSEFRVEQVQAATGTGEIDSEKIATEIEILKSKTLALDTIRTLHLDQNPIFRAPIPGRPWDLSRPGDRAALIGTFQKDLSVLRLGHTDIIQIFVTSKHPELASLMANTLIDAYIEHSFQDSYSSTQKISTWLSAQLGGLKERLQDSQTRMLQLQQQGGIIGLDQQHSFAISSLEELNKQLADAEVNRLLKESQLKAFQSSTPDVIDAMSQQYLTLQVARQNLAQLKVEYASLIQTYGAAYPRVKELKAQINQLQENVSADEQAQISRAEKEREAAQSNENALRKTLEAEEQLAYSNGSNVVAYELARREYQANRELYDGIQERLIEAGIMAGLHSTAIHIVDNADIPIAPSRPRVNLNLVGGFGIGLFLGLVFAVVREAMDTHIKSIFEFEEMLQLPLLTAVPKVDPKLLGVSTFLEHAQSGKMGAWSQIAETLRGLRTSILLSTPGAPPKVIMVTSTRPAEGKSAISIMASIIFAVNGARVLLMDADLRRPTIHLRMTSAFGASMANANSAGLTSVLSGKAKLSEAIQECPGEPHLHILFAGPTPPLPSELLGSRQMEELLEEIRPHYDFIFIDTPPVLTVTDASILGRLADASLLVVRYGDAQRHVLARSIEILRRSGANVLGLVLNAVDFRSPEYAEYYGPKYYNYYGTQPTE